LLGEATLGFVTAFGFAGAFVFAGAFAGAFGFAGAFAGALTTALAGALALTIALGLAAALEATAGFVVAIRFFGVAFTEDTTSASIIFESFTVTGTLLSSPMASLKFLTAPPNITTHIT